MLANSRKDHSRSMPHPMIPAQWPEKRFLETRHKQGTVTREWTVARENLTMRRKSFCSLQNRQIILEAKRAKRDTRARNAMKRSCITFRGVCSAPTQSAGEKKLLFQRGISVLNSMANSGLYVWRKSFCVGYLKWFQHAYVGINGQDQELATRKDQCIVVANGRLSVPLAYQDLQEIISAVFYAWDEIFENNNVIRREPSIFCHPKRLLRSNNLTRIIFSRS